MTITSRNQSRSNQKSRNRFLVYGIAAETRLWNREIVLAIARRRRFPPPNSAVQSHRESLPGPQLLMVVVYIFALSGYDRVMAYKFHDDDHGEVVSEITKPGLEPYLGLHYPATDIPQAARFLFMKNKVRMIVDCRAKHVKVLQDDKLDFELTLCGSTLRAPHTCHLQYMENMESIASLVMAVIVNESDDGDAGGEELQQKRKRLWGLVVCHNTSPRTITITTTSSSTITPAVIEAPVHSVQLSDLGAAEIGDKESSNPVSTSQIPQNR
ncbi:Phytochrome A [Linum grandiflorum]